MRGRRCDEEERYESRRLVRRLCVETFADFDEFGRMVGVGQDGVTIAPIDIFAANRADVEVFARRLVGGVFGGGSAGNDLGHGRETEFCGAGSMTVPSRSWEAVFAAPPLPQPDRPQGGGKSMALRLGHESSLWLLRAEKRSAYALRASAR